MFDSDVFLIPEYSFWCVLPDAVGQCFRHYLFLLFRSPILLLVPIYFCREIRASSNNWGRPQNIRASPKTLGPAQIFRGCKKRKTGGLSLALVPCLAVETCLFKAFVLPRINFSAVKHYGETCLTVDLVCPVHLSNKIPYHGNFRWNITPQVLNGP